MQLVVLGAAGGVGHHAVALAAQRGHRVVAVARRRNGVPTGDGVTTALVDARDPRPCGRCSPAPTRCCGASG